MVVGGASQKDGGTPDLVSDLEPNSVYEEPPRGLCVGSPKLTNKPVPVPELTGHGARSQGTKRFLGPP